jgi:hypothetical protein
MTPSLKPPPAFTLKSLVEVQSQPKNTAPLMPRPWQTHQMAWGKLTLQRPSLSQAYWIENTAQIKYVYHVWLALHQALPPAFRLHWQGRLLYPVSACNYVQKNRLAFFFAEERAHTLSGTGESL